MSANGVDWVRSVQAKFGFIAGVPDSSLAPVSGLWRQCGNNSVICANEGAAVAIAAGWAMGSNGCPLVYMQNSGLPGALNPLMSFTHRLVHSVPMVLLIGLRGRPGDEPQHQTIGRSTEALLRAADIAFHTVQEASGELLRDALYSGHGKATEIGAPVAVLAAYAAPQPLDRPGGGGRSMEEWTSREAVRLLLDCARPGSIIVSSTGFNTRYVNEYRREKPARFPEYVYCVGSMGYACSVAQGLAVARPSDPILCIDGDGAALMHLGTLFLTTTGLNVPNLSYAVINNGSHESVGGGDTPGTDLSFSDLVDANGWRTGRFHGPTSSSTMEAVTDLLAGNGPSLIEMFTRPVYAAPPPRPRAPFSSLQNFHRQDGKNRD